MYNQPPPPSSSSSSSSAIPSLFQLPPPPTPPSLLGGNQPRPLLGPSWSQPPPPPPPSHSSSSNIRNQRPGQQQHQYQSNGAKPGQIQPLMQPPPPPASQQQPTNRAVPLLNLNLAAPPPPPPPQQSQQQQQQFQYASAQPPQPLLSMNSFGLAGKAVPLMHIQPTPSTSLQAPSIVPPPPLAASPSAAQPPARSEPSAVSPGSGGSVGPVEVVFKGKIVRYDRIDTNSLIESFLRPVEFVGDEDESENYESSCFDERNYRCDQDEENEEDEAGDEENGTRRGGSRPRFSLQTTDFNHGLSSSSSSSSSSGQSSTRSTSQASDESTGKFGLVAASDASVSSKSNSSKSNSSASSNSNSSSSSSGASKNSKYSSSSYQSPSKPPSLLSLKVTASMPTLSSGSAVSSASSRLPSEPPASNLFPILPTSDGQRSGYSSASSLNGSGNHQRIALEDIIQRPGRDRRAPKIAIVFRGLPGSGKSRLTNLIKAEEEKYVGASEKPKILSIDNYFISEHEVKAGNKTQIVMKYEYDKAMDETYQRSLVKAFKKTLDDGLYNFVIVDMINNRMGLVDEMNLHATLRGYKLYVIELTDDDVATCHARNTHERSLAELHALTSAWDKLPAHYAKIDPRNFEPSGEAENADMSLDSENEEDEQLKDDDRRPAQITLPAKSKWETSRDDEAGAEETQTRKSTSASAKREPLTLEEYLDDSDLRGSSPGKHKKIRWQDDEDPREDMGFFIGQSPKNRTNLITSNPNVMRSNPNAPFDKFKYHH